MRHAKPAWVLAAASLFLSVLLWWGTDSCYGDGCIGIALIAMGMSALTGVLCLVALILTLIRRDK